MTCVHVSVLMNQNVLFIGAVSSVIHTSNLVRFLSTRSLNRFNFPVLKVLNNFSSVIIPAMSSSSDAVNNGNVIEKAKRLAAIKAVDNHVKTGDVVGVGSGSTIVYAVTRLAERVKEEKLSIQCIPTSFQAKQLILENGLNLSSLEVMPYHCNVAIDGADEADDSLTLIKGGGGCLAQEKIIAENSDLFVMIADERKKSQKLGTSWQKGVPIEVLPLSYKPIQFSIQKRFGGTPNLRMAKAKAGPVVTDNGNFILDWVFDLGEVRERTNSSNDEEDFNLWHKVNTELCCMAGVVDTGLFVSMAKVAYFGTAEGNVIEVDKRQES